MAIYSVSEVEPRICLKETNQHPYHTRLSTPEEVLSFLQDYVSDLATECILVFNLDNRGQVINFNRAAIGTINMAVSTGREIFKTAILSNASSILICHNHLSSDPSPSEEDVLFTRRLVNCGELLGIPLIEHLIITPEQTYYSFRINHSDIFTITIDRQKNGTYVIDTDVQSRDDLGTQEYWTAFINSKQYQEYIVQRDTFWGQQWTKDQDNTQKYVVYDFNDDGQNELLVEYMGCNHMFFYIREDGGIDAVQISPYYTQDLKIDKNTNLVMMPGAYQGRGDTFFAYYEFTGQEFHLVFTTKPNGDCYIEEGASYSKEQAMKIENDLSDFDWIKIQ